MAKFFDVNNLIGADGGAEVVYRIKEVLVDAGWSVIESSDGTTWSNDNGDTITGFAAGAGGMNNANAWIRLQDPGARREFTLQRGATEEVWRVKYSALDKFVASAGSATETPLGSDQAILLGGGSDAAPTFAQMVPVGGGYRYHITAQSTVTGNVYPFWCFGKTTPGAVTINGFILEPIVPSTQEVEDTDQCIIYLRYNLAFNMATAGWITEGGANTFRGWLKYNLGGESFEAIATIPPVLSSGFPIFQQFSITSPYSSKLVGLPIFFATPQGSEQFKGYAQYIRGKLQTTAYPHTFNSTVDAFVFVDDALIPYPDNIAPTV